MVNEAEYYMEKRYRSRKRSVYQFRKGWALIHTP